MIRILIFIILVSNCFAIGNPSFFNGYTDLYEMKEDVKTHDLFTRANKKYYSDRERAIYYLYQKNNKLFDSEGNLANVDKKKFILAPNGKLYSFNDLIRSIYSLESHSVLSGGLKIACGGYIQIKEGLIEFVSNMTGHYKCTLKGTLNILDYISRNGAYKEFMLEHLYPQDGAIERFQFKISKDSVIFVANKKIRNGHRFFYDTKEVVLVNGICNQKSIVACA